MVLKSRFLWCKLFLEYVFREQSKPKYLKRTDFDTCGCFLYYVKGASFLYIILILQHVLFHLQLSQSYKQEGEIKNNVLMIFKAVCL